jgi:hypothetical protein
MKRARYGETLAEWAALASGLRGACASSGGIREGIIVWAAISLNELVAQRREGA